MFSSFKSPWMPSSMIRFISSNSCFFLPQNTKFSPLVPFDSYLMYQHYQILNILDETTQILDLSNYSSFSIPFGLIIFQLNTNEYKGFYTSEHKPYNFLKKYHDSLDKLTLNDPVISLNDPAISLIGYSHLDSCWIWPFNITRDKLANTAISILLLININNDETIKN